jgi:ubiquinone/menaquinone biosynthesis C-methylase UbiE
VPAQLVAQIVDAASCYLSAPMQGKDGVRTPRRALAVTQIADLRPTDDVLDVGCAEGDVALALAGFVARLHGLDSSPARVRRAAEHAAERGIRNATFEVAAIQEYPFEPRSWDVTLFMRVWGKGDGDWQVGDAEFERVLRTTRRQTIVQAGKRRSEERLHRILEICDDHGFDVASFERQYLIVANRRGAGARIRALPERVLVPTRSGPMLVPTETTPDHPIVRSFDPDLRAAV